MSRNVWALGIVLALVLILLVGVGLVVSNGWGHGYGWGMMGPGMTFAPALRPGASAGVGGWWGIPFLGMIFGMALVGVIIGGVVWFVQSVSRGGSRPGSSPTAAETPLEILKRRYASGELTKEQFEEMRRTLDS